MKVRIFKCSDPSCWYASRLVGEKFDVIKEEDDRYEVKGLDNFRCFIMKEDCDVVDEVTMSGPQYETESDPNMKQIKMSIDTAREWYALLKETSNPSVNQPGLKFLLENFTKEELEPKNGMSRVKRSKQDNWEPLSPLNDRIIDNMLCELFKRKRIEDGRKL